MHKFTINIEHRKEHEELHLAMRLQGYEYKGYYVCDNGEKDNDAYGKTLYRAWLACVYVGDKEKVVRVEIPVEGQPSLPPRIIDTPQGAYRVLMRDLAEYDE